MSSTNEGSAIEAQRDALRKIADDARDSFAETHEAREQALRLSREIIRNSANSIRATHRAEYDQARELLSTLTQLVEEMDTVLEDHRSVYYAGYVEDAHKEYVEAHATLAFVQQSKLPTPEELGVGPAPYLNGLAEAVGELRRSILDALRREDLSQCETLLEVMDEVYSILVSMDFPEAVTRGLRRSTDMARGTLERTRGDLTVALRQGRLEKRLADLHDSLSEATEGPP